MRKYLPSQHYENKSVIRIALISFGLGILLAFFLSARVLVFIEAILIILAGGLSLSER